MKPFTKRELTGVVIIIGLVFLVTLNNMRIALRRSRDTTRKQDMGSVSDALHRYYQNFGFFPPSENGMIKACKGENFDKILSELEKGSVFDRTKFFEGLRGCVWGKDSFPDVSDSSFEPYLSVLPQDPKGGEGLSYFYLSNTAKFQLYTSLEGNSEEEGYNADIVRRNLLCGIKLCSYGKSFSDTPLDKSIEEYEEELLEKQKVEDSKY